MLPLRNKSSGPLPQSELTLVPLVRTCPEFHQGCSSCPVGRISEPMLPANRLLPTHKAIQDTLGPAVFDSWGQHEPGTPQLHYMQPALPSGWALSVESKKLCRDVCGGRGAETYEASKSLESLLIPSNSFIWQVKKWRLREGGDLIRAM